MSVMAPKLPAVLQQPHNNSISMVRALKNIIRVLEECTEMNLSEFDNTCLESAIDDAKTMLAAIDHG